jgi:hypothetical protein
VRHITITFRSRLHEVYRDSDGHLLCVMEITTDRGALVALSVFDPRDYEVEE